MQKLKQDPEVSEMNKLTDTLHNEHIIPPRVFAKLHKMSCNTNPGGVFNLGKIKPAKNGSNF